MDCPCCGTPLIISAKNELVDQRSRCFMVDALIEELVRKQIREHPGFDDPASQLRPA
jgi:hypothetical protein